MVPDVLRRRPTRCSCVAGDVEAEDVTQKRREVLRRHSVRPAASTSPRRGSPSARASQRQTMQDRVPQARIIKVWNVPPYRDRRRHASRLVVDCWPAARRRGSTSGSSTRTGPRPTSSASSTTARSAARSGSGPTCSPAATARPWRRRSTRRSRAFLAKARRRRSWNARADADARRVRPRHRADRRLRRQVRHARARAGLLGRSRRVQGPARDLRRPPPPTAARRARAGCRRRRTCSRCSPSPSTRPPHRRRPIEAARRRPRRRSAAPAVERATLSNGLKVVLVARPAVPVVRLRMVLDGGFAADAPTSGRGVDGHGDARRGHDDAHGAADGGCSWRRSARGSRRRRRPRRVDRPLSRR